MVEQAREELQSTGSLSLPTRKKLWLALGEVKKNADYAERTVGLQKRVKLATECVKRVLNIWDAGIGEDMSLVPLLSAVDKYLTGKISVEQLEQILNHYRQIVEEVSYSAEDERCGVVGLAACYVANIAQYDEVLFEVTDSEDLDEELDSFTWDTSYLISLLYSEEERAEYWSWYLQRIEEAYVEYSQKH